MNALSVMAAIVCGTIVAAQEPGARITLGDASDPTGPTRGWALASDPDSTADLRPLVEGHGPGVRINAPSGLTLIRPEWLLSGTYTVSALFQRTSRSPGSAPYGLIVGATSTGSGMAFLVRPDSTFAVIPITRLTGSVTWTSTGALRQQTADDPPVDRLEVRVVTASAVFLINGTEVAVVPVATGSLDGWPGVSAGAAAEVAVAAFGIARPNAPFEPGK